MLHSLDFLPQREALQFVPVIASCVYVFLIVFPLLAMQNINLTPETLFGLVVQSGRDNSVSTVAERVVLRRCALISTPLVYLLALWCHTTTVRLVLFPALIAVPAFIGAIAYYFRCRQQQWLNVGGWQHFARADVLETIEGDVREFRYVSISSGNLVLLATSSYIIVERPFNFHVLQTRRTTLVVESWTSVVVAEDEIQGQQDRLRVRFSATLPHSSALLDASSFAMTADELDALQHVAPVVSLTYAAGVPKRRTLLEQFEIAFTEEVQSNDRVVWTNVDDLEPCFGCGERESEVKLRRTCPPSPVYPVCGDCNCRPMWCVRCLSRVFASKQPRDAPDSWMLGKADCPTCRRVFCIRDVALLSHISLQERQ